METTVDSSESAGELQVRPEVMAYRRSNEKYRDLYEKLAK
jgi:hypothetical protein